MKQIEEEDQQLQFLHQEVAHQRFEQSRLSRAKAEGKCLLGLVTFTPIGGRPSESPKVGTPAQPLQAAASSSPLPGSNLPAVDKEQ